MCGRRCWPGAGRWCRRWRGWAGWARRSWRRSTRTGSPRAYDLVWWIAAEQAGLIGEQVAALAAELGCAGPGADLARGAGGRCWASCGGGTGGCWCSTTPRTPQDLAPWLPGGAGHVLITSRARGWAEVAVPVEVDVLARAESVAILRDRVPGLAEADADRVAAALGDLPLAIAQAAGYLAETGMPAGEYADLLGPRAAQLLDEGRPSSYPRSLAAVTVLALDRLAGQDPAAAEVAGVCAFLAPEPVPAEWFPGAAAELPAVLAGQAADPVAWRQVLGRVSRSALARADHRRAADAPAHPGHHPRLPAAGAGRRYPGPGRGHPGRQQPRRRRRARHLARVGAAAAAPAGPGPRRHQQPGPARAGLRRSLVPDRAR